VAAVRASHPLCVRREGLKRPTTPGKTDVSRLYRSEVGPARGIRLATPVDDHNSRSPLAAAPEASSACRFPEKRRTGGQEHGRRHCGKRSGGDWRVRGRRSIMARAPALRRVDSAERSTFRGKGRESWGTEEPRHPPILRRRGEPVGTGNSTQQANARGVFPAGDRSVDGQ